MPSGIEAFCDLSKDWPHPQKAKAALSVARAVLKMWESNGERLEVCREAIHAMRESIRCRGSSQRAALLLLVKGMEQYYKMLTRIQEHASKNPPEEAIAVASCGTILSAIYVVVNGDQSRWIQCLVFAQQSFAAANDSAEREVDAASEQVIAWASAASD